MYWLVQFKSQFFKQISVPFSIRSIVECCPRYEKNPTDFEVLRLSSYLWTCAQAKPWILGRWHTASWRSMQNRRFAVHVSLKTESLVSVFAFSLLHNCELSWRILTMVIISDFKVIIILLMTEMNELNPK